MKVFYYQALIWPSKGRNKSVQKIFEWPSWPLVTCSPICYLTFKKKGSGVHVPFFFSWWYSFYRCLCVCGDGVYFYGGIYAHSCVRLVIRPLHRSGWHFNKSFCICNGIRLKSWRAHSLFPPSAFSERLSLAFSAIFNISISCCSSSFCGAFLTVLYLSSSLKLYITSL